MPHAPYLMPKLIEWDSLQIRVNGDKVNEIAARFRVDPIERMTLRFFNGLLRIEGSLKKFISVPFTVDIAEILADGTTIRVPVKSASAFGAIPIPRFLFTLAKSRLPREMITFEEPATFVIALDRFLPTFVSADIQSIWIIDGGLAVTMGRGGADLP